MATTSLAALVDLVRRTLSKLISLSRLTTVLPRRILAFFLAVNKKVSASLDRANTVRFVSLFRLLLMPLRCQSESIRWAVDSPPAPIYDMCVDHRRTHIRMAQQFLHGSNVIPILQQVGGKGMAERMTACRFGDLCFESGFLEWMSCEQVCKWNQAATSCRAARWF